MKDYDIVIVGAGCSGLSLAFRLINSAYSVCLIENKSVTNRIRKTWSYWDTYKHPFKHLDKYTNNKLSIHNNNSTSILDCSEHNYCSIDSDDFDKHVLTKIDECTNVEIMFDTEIKEIITTDNTYDIKFNKGSINAKYIFDSRPDRRVIEMRQIFKGLFVRFGKQINNFNAQLMDFTKKSEFHFFYCLPMGDDMYLFESTYYTSMKKDKNKMTDEVHEYIKQRYGNEYSVVREEYGEIPLTTNVKINNKNSKYINIGIPSGATRASTGYTFLNIQKQTDEYIKKLNGDTYTEYSDTFRSRVLRKMDNVLLQIIKDHPMVSKNILYRMFKCNDSKRVIRFLSDKPTLLDILLIVWNMPKLIFIKYAIKSFTTRSI
jgi:lycopene beta-cyclase|uniref:Predicted lycopene cyclase n=1 Tax=uncultured bacterium BAC13K9BAC TaxID=332979 RepID=Q4JMX1_9BACT|nr:predicted lycopene cyclase [uncultured bacterium BAC13K9BAC]